MDWKIVYKVKLKSTLFKFFKEVKQTYILLFLYRSLSSAVKKKKKSQSKVSYLYLSNISLPLACALFLNYFPPLVSSSVSWRSRTAQISEQVQLHWHDSKKPWKIFIFFFPPSSLTYCRAQIVLLSFLRCNKYNNTQLVPLRNVGAIIME